MIEFVRATKLHDVKGRANYVSDPERQEDIVARSSQRPDWEVYAKYEHEHQKSTLENNEGRELIVALPNEWIELPVGELSARVDALAVAGVGKTTDWEWAVHNNAEGANLHAHIIFSERQVMADKVRRYDRDIYLTQEGKVARRAADRARDGAGNMLPPVHRKGETVIEGFTAKDPRYTTRGWITGAKDALKTHIAVYGVVYTPRGEYEVHQYHQGKGKDSGVIAAKNEVIRKTNAAMRFAEQHGANKPFLMEVRDKLLVLLKGRRMPRLDFEPKEMILSVYDAKEAPKRTQNTQEAFMAIVPPKLIMSLRHFVEPQRGLENAPEGWIETLEKAGYIKVDRGTGYDVYDIKKWTAQITDEGIRAYKYANNPKLQKHDAMLSLLTKEEREMYDSDLFRNRPNMREQFLKGCIEDRLDRLPMQHHDRGLER